MDAGAPVKGFVAWALAETVGEHPDVLGFYAVFLEKCVAPIPAFWSHLVAFGEVAVGLGLLFGVLTTAAAFFASVMNMSFLLAGSVGLNPYLLALQIPLIFAWRVSSRIGLTPIMFRVFHRLREHSVDG
jgi:thiosulfate dehydrogenase [quinone] large subunit